LALKGPIKQKMGYEGNLLLRAYAIHVKKLI
jgi:hypothetical protein